MFTYNYYAKSDNLLSQFFSINGLQGFVYFFSKMYSLVNIKTQDVFVSLVYFSIKS